MFSKLLSVHIEHFIESIAYSSYQLAVELKHFPFDTTYQLMISQSNP